MCSHVMLESVYSVLYFVQDENNFINPLLQVGSGSGSGSSEKVPDPDPAGQKSTDPTGSGSSSLDNTTAFQSMVKKN